MGMGRDQRWMYSSFCSAYTLSAAFWVKPSVMCDVLVMMSMWVGQLVILNPHTFLSLLVTISFIVKVNGLGLC